MSLINQMLQDLEKRRASAAERGALPNQVRPLPPVAAEGPPWKWLGLVGLVLLTAAVLWQFRRPTHDAVEPEATADAQALKPDKAQPTLHFEHELKSMPTARILDSKKSSSKLASANLAASAPAPESIAIDKPTVPTPLSTPDAASIVGQPLAPAAPPQRSVIVGKKKQPALAADTQIDKQVHPLTPAEQAENDYRRGVELLNQGQLPEAQDAFTLALSESPAHTAARQTLFGLLINLKKNDEAERVLQDGLALNPAQPGFARALASLQAGRGDNAAAIETLRASEASAQTNPDYLAFLAGLLQREARHEEAVAQYQAVLKLAPQSGIWWMGLGISLQALNRNAEARDAFTRAKGSNALTPELQAFVDQRLKQVQ